MLVALLGFSFWRLREPRELVQERAPAVFTGATMGTTYQVKLAGNLPQDAYDRVAAAIEHELATVNASMSTYRQGSELSRFNREAPAHTPVAVSPALRRVLEVALDVGDRSGGALDITVGPAVQAWGFGPGDGGLPSRQRRARLLAHIGLSHLRLSPAGLTRDDDGVRLDLSAVAKGHAVDRVAATLESLGYPDFLVEVGGELRARGRRPNGAGWQVGIEKPMPGQRRVERVIPLRDLGMATSGDYRNFIEHQGQRRSHLFDPRTAEPVVHDLASVTVLHPETAVADAWATALSVLGPDEGPRVARREGLAAFFVVRDGGEGFRSLETLAFSQLAGQDRTQ